MKKRKEEHERVLEKMRNSMSNVNTEIEDDIRVASVLYKQGVKDSKRETSDCLQNIRQILKGVRIVCLLILFIQYFLQKCNANYLLIPTTKLNYHVILFVAYF